MRVADGISDAIGNGDLPNAHEAGTAQLELMETVSYGADVLEMQRGGSRRGEG